MDVCIICQYKEIWLQNWNKSHIIINNIPEAQPATAAATTASANASVSTSSITVTQGEGLNHQVHAESQQGTRSTLEYGMINHTLHFLDKNSAQRVLRDCLYFSIQKGKKV